jgi:hypothetical protein
MRTEIEGYERWNVYSEWVALECCSIRVRLEDLPDKVNGVIGDLSSVSYAKCLYSTSIRHDRFLPSHFEFSFSWII